MRREASGYGPIAQMARFEPPSLLTEAAAWHCLLALWTPLSLSSFRQSQQASLCAVCHEACQHQQAMELARSALAVSVTHRGRPHRVVAVKGPSCWVLALVAVGRVRTSPVNASARLRPFPLVLEACNIISTTGAVTSRDT